MHDKKRKHPQSNGLLWGKLLAVRREQSIFEFTGRFGFISLLYFFQRQHSGEDGEKKKKKKKGVVRKT